MKSILIILSLFFTINLHGQKSDFQVLTKTKTIGKNLVDSTAITGTEYIFPERIHETFLDTTTGYLTVQLRGLSANGKWLDNGGNILQYDLRRKNLLWHKKIVYMTSYLQQFSKTIILTDATKSYCLDIHSGKELWEVKNNLYFVDPIDQIGVGYKFKSSTGYTNDLEGIDLTDGSILWKRNLNREYGWNDVLYTNDSTMIVAAAGLHEINIHSGQGWDYHTITGKKNYAGTAAANAVGVVAGLLTGTYVMSTGHNVVRSVVSNILTDSSYLYFASKEQLSKVDKRSGAIA